MKSPLNNFIRLSACLLFIAPALLSSAQTINFPWHTGTYGGSNGNRTYSVSVSGNTMSATIVNNQNVWNSIGCATSPTGGTSCCGGNGLVLGTDWTSTAGNITVTITFAIAVAAPVTFTVQDINSNYCDLVVNSQDCYFWDEVAVTGTLYTGASITPTATEASGQTKATSAPWVMIRALPESGSVSWCATANSFSVGTAGQCVKTITIIYRNRTGEANAIYNGNPYPQYVYVSQITAGTVTATAPSSISGTSTLCSSTPITLTANGGNASTQWFSGSCGGSTAGTGAAISITPPAGTTTYYARNIVCETTSACVNLPVNVISVNATASASPATLCAGTSTLLTSTGATTYNWSNGAGSGSSVSVTPASTTTYTVTGTTSGCTGTNTVAVTVKPLPSTAALASSSSVCAGSSTTLTANGADSYNWSDGLGGNSTVNVTPSMSTVYAVTGTTNGCTATAMVPVNVMALPNCVADYFPDEICNGDAMDLSSSPTGETTTITENFDGASQMFTLVNGPYNKWYQGAVAACNGSAKGLFIGTNSTTRGYINYQAGTGGISTANFAYLDVPITGDVSATLSFLGEVGGKATDHITVWSVPATTTLTPGSEIIANASNVLLAGPFYGYTGACYPVSGINLQPWLGTTRRIVFQWRNNADVSNTGDAIATRIDDVVITQTHSFSYSWSSNPAGFTSNSQSPHVNSATENTTYTVTVTRSDGCVRSSSVTTNGCPPPLPIDLLEFSGKVLTKENELYWETASETNNDLFVVQRSMDGINFSDLMNIDGAGNSNSIRYYHCFDADPLPDAYYRLKQVDFDGAFSFSDLVFLHRGSPCNIGGMKVWQHSNEGLFFVSFNAFRSDKVDFNIMDLTGRRLISGTWDVREGQNKFSMDLGSLQNGVYYLQTFTEDQDVVYKILKY